MRLPARGPNLKGLGSGRLTAALAGLLGLAYLLVLSGRIAEDRSVVAANSAPFGTSALRAVLEASGYRVRVENRRAAPIAPDELVVAFRVLERGRYPLSDEELPAPEDKNPLLSRLPTARRTILFGIETARGASPDPTYRTTAVGDGPKADLEVNAGDHPPPDLGLKNGIVLARLGREGDELAYVAGPSGPGASERRVVSVAHGEMAQNLGIDRAGNAAYVLGLVRAFAPGKAVVLYEGLQDPRDGLLAALGDWAFAARNQAFLVLGCLLAALGSRFGLPPKTRRREMGQREQSDALGNLLRRWRGPAVGIEAGIEQARRRLVKARRLPASAPREQWTKYLSPRFLAVLADCDEWVRQNAREREALAALARLDAATAAEIESPRPNGPA